METPKNGCFLLLNGTQYARPKNGGTQYAMPKKSGTQYARGRGVSPSRMYAYSGPQVAFGYTKNWQIERQKREHFNEVQYLTFLKESRRL